MKIVTGSDNAGYEMKLALTAHMEALGHEVTDVGCFSTESVDYPLYGRLAAEKVAAGEADRLLLVCGTGFGISLAANKIKGIRCVNCTEPYTAVLSRNHNDSNGLSLGARVIGIELAKMIVTQWLSASFEGERHARRVDMIKAMEK
jgi:ribose 5-phosphate isomerase B